MRILGAVFGLLLATSAFAAQTAVQSKQGGTGVTPAVNTSGGVPLVNGTITTGDCLQWSSTGLQDAGAACGTGSGGGTSIQSDALTVTATNTLSNLTQTPVAGLMNLQINGVTFSSAGSSPPFSVSGTTITWNSSTVGYNIATTDKVTAVYSVSGSGSGGGGLAIGATGITGGTAGYFLTVGAGNVLQQSSSSIALAIGTAITSSTAGYGLYVNSSSQLAQFAYGSGNYAALLAAANTSTGFPLVSGSIATGDCLRWGPGIQDSGSSCGSGSGGVLTVGNATSDTSLTINGTGTGPYTGSITAKLNLANAQTWGATQTFPAGSLTLSELATQTANSIVGNGAASTASPTALSVPSCSSSSNALIWTAGTGFGCNTITTASALTNVYDAISQYNLAKSISTSSSDQATNLQNALTAAGNAGGGIVFVGDGIFNLKSQVVVPAHVTLQCASNGGTSVNLIGSAGYSYSMSGTFFAVLWGSGSLGSGPPYAPTVSSTLSSDAIIVKSNGGVKNCGFWYPNQVTSGSPTAYGATILLYADTAGSSTVYGANFKSTITDNFCANCFFFIDARGSMLYHGGLCSTAYVCFNAGFNISRNFGSPIYVGIWVDLNRDWSTFNDNTFNSGALSYAVYTTAPWTWPGAYGIAIYLGPMDGLTVNTPQIWGYNTGIFVQTSYYATQPGYYTYAPNPLANDDYQAAGAITINSPSCDACYVGVQYYSDDVDAGISGITSLIIANGTFFPWQVSSTPNSGSPGYAFATSSNAKIQNFIFKNNYISNYAATSASLAGVLLSNAAGLKSVIIENNYDESAHSPTQAFATFPSATIGTLLIENNVAPGYPTSTGNNLSLSYTATNAIAFGNFN